MVIYTSPNLSFPTEWLMPSWKKTQQAYITQQIQLIQGSLLQRGLRYLSESCFSTNQCVCKLACLEKLYRPLSNVPLCWAKRNIFMPEEWMRKAEVGTFLIHVTAFCLYSCHMTTVILKRPLFHVLHLNDFMCVWQWYQQRNKCLQRKDQPQARWDHCVVFVYWWKMMAEIYWMSWSNLYGNNR